MKKYKKLIITIVLTVIIFLVSMFFINSPRFLSCPTGTPFIGIPDNPPEMNLKEKIKEWYDNKFCSEKTIFQD